MNYPLKQERFVADTRRAKVRVVHTVRPVHIYIVSTEYNECPSEPVKCSKLNNYIKTKRDFLVML